MSDFSFGCSFLPALDLAGFSTAELFDRAVVETHDGGIGAEPVELLDSHAELSVALAVGHLSFWDRHL